VAGWSGGWLEGDGVSEGFEPGDEPTGLPVGVQAAGEVAGTEFVVGRAGGQDVPDDHDQCVGHHDDRLLRRTVGPFQSATASEVGFLASRQSAVQLYPGDAAPGIYCSRSATTAK
jgi:hypothetical protein